MQERIPIAVVRQRPAMYVGNTDDGSGLVHLTLELVANAYDQYLVGRCSRVEVTIAADGTITVEDDGPGIPAAGGDGLPPLDRLLTELSTRPTVDGHRPHLALGGFGLGVVNALSERYVVERVTADATGGIELVLAGGFVLAVFPDDSQDRERWRLLRPGDPSSHFVVSASQIEDGPA